MNDEPDKAAPATGPAMRQLGQLEAHFQRTAQFMEREARTAWSGVDDLLIALQAAKAEAQQLRDAAEHRDSAETDASEEQG